jgi:hypothetical protein
VQELGKRKKLEIVMVPPPTAVPFESTKDTS